MKRYILAPISVGEHITRELLVEGVESRQGVLARLTRDGVVEVQKGSRTERYLVSERVRKVFPEEEFIIPYAQPFEVVCQSKQEV